ncbi:d-ribitol-5-phosphate cytidylyltransferase [Caerostris darwini]|uniref:D-ribitol-5-phosphate cytidylyltransferase n=1 Tax=Caerostris darwini TaxID=1538125 RepID=A0AAV4SK32_9ARAC|nr:d-ribitol-5-phosphate cytidylyltransferase [Caerostris darwini]
MEAECKFCSKIFKKKKNLYEHLRKTHKINPNISGKVECPLNCGNKFRLHVELRNHLEVSHKHPIQQEIHEFADFESFQLWKTKYEETTGYGYTRRISEKALANGDIKSHFICHRSGIHKSGSTGQRKLKKIGSNKIGTTCPSTLEVTRISSGKVKVVFYKTHIGHKADPEHAVVHKQKGFKRLESIRFGVCAILPTIGKGELIGIDTPVPYISIHQKPLICYAIEAILKLPFIQKVVVLAPSGSLHKMLNVLRENCSLQGQKVMVAEGAETIHESIKSALKILQTCCETQPEVVIVHDGTRPFLPSDEIMFNLIMASKEHGASGFTCPLNAVMVSADESAFLDICFDRNEYVACETPQAFQLEVLSKAYESISTNDLEHGTECLKIVRDYAGIKPKLLPSTSHLWKVTHRKDIFSTAALVKENQSVAIITVSTLEFLPSLKKTLLKSFKSVHVAGIFTPGLFDLYQNFVFIYEHNNPYDIIENMNICNGKKLKFLCTVVHIFTKDFDDTINFVEFQKHASTTGRKLTKSNIVSYIFAWSQTDSTEKVDHSSETVRSLLFDSNVNLSGTIFFS